jgi:hypothetical protein
MKRSEIHNARNKSRARSLSAPVFFLNSKNSNISTFYRANEGEAFTSSSHGRWYKNKRDV